MKKGTRASNQMNLVMIGPEGAGKTSTVDSFLGKQFQKDQPQTDGAELNSCTVKRILLLDGKKVKLMINLKSYQQSLKVK